MHHREHKTWKKFKARQQTFHQRPRPIRYAIIALGFFLVLGGLAIGPLPGPGPVILIPLGLSFLALQFSWAEKALAKALEYFLAAQQRAKNASRTQRILGALVSVCFVAAWGYFIWQAF